MDAANLFHRQQAPQFSNKTANLNSIFVCLNYSLMNISISLRLLHVSVYFHCAKRGMEEKIFRKMSWLKHCTEGKWLAISVQFFNEKPFRLLLRHYSVWIGVGAISLVNWAVLCGGKTFFIISKEPYLPVSWCGAKSMVKTEERKNFWMESAKNS